jgi:hypothetical protein
MNNKVSAARLRQDLRDIKEEEDEEAMAQQMRMEREIQSGINRNFLNEERAARGYEPLPLVPQVSTQKLKILQDDSLVGLNRRNRLYSKYNNTDTGGYRGVKKRSYKKRSCKKRSYNKKRSYKKRSCKK